MERIRSRNYSSMCRKHVALRCSFDCSILVVLVVPVVLLLLLVVLLPYLVLAVQVGSNFKFCSLMKLSEVWTVQAGADRIELE
jgi:hypothetical protein